jgi:hypothetical protein
MPIRSADDARYFTTWIDAISQTASDCSGWPSEAEKSHVLSQFEEARKAFAERFKPSEQ